MKDQRRRFITRMFVYSGTLGICKNSNLAYACLDPDGYPEYIPIDTLTDISHGPITDYLRRHYGSTLSIEHDASLLISTPIIPENYVITPAKFKFPEDYFLKEHPEQRCLGIDIFDQALSFRTSIPRYNYRANSKSRENRPIYRIASYKFGTNTFMDTKIRYRRTFHDSILIAVATLIDRRTNIPSKIVYNYSEILKGGPPCGAVVLTD